ncbi:hypothetical protein GCM10008014_12390 [Paenibacillus silvae]|uniref:Integrase catalytic domain-containing protein n=1 Tax=Paenibacillus silvae TaxID=1325358 RepID=A0ABQ1Z5R5_9BACL|nr:hypothetical protein GCM10008014_12390 [Paenibacillus silvae]
MRNNWRVCPERVFYSIERVFDNYMLGRMSRLEYCQRVGYLLQTREVR